MDYRGITLALKTTAANVLEAAARHRNSCPSVEHYVPDQLVEHLTPYMRWLL